MIGYYTPFERGRLQELAAAVPELAEELESVIERLVDLRPCIVDHVYHPDFNGSFSLKNVLPALVTDLGYEDLEVRDGTIASLRLKRLLVDGEPADPAARAQLRRSLEDYCRTDTLATRRLLERLREIAAR